MQAIKVERKKMMISLNPLSLSPKRSRRTRPTSKAKMRESVLLSKNSCT
jgi:hypothetical protein